MNVIVANEQHTDLMNNLDIDIIKSLSGSYSASEIVKMFSSFFYSKMILDVTAISDNDSIDSYVTISRGLGADKIIFLLPQGSSMCTPSFLAKLIDLGIYNFTTNISGVKYLFKKPNELKDVEHIKNLALNQKKKAMENTQNNSSSDDKSVEDVSDSKDSSDNNSHEEDDHVNSDAPAVAPHKPVVIGVKSITDHAGSTTFIFMLKRELSLTFGSENVVALEVDKNDFQVFNDKSMISIKQDEIKDSIERYSSANIVLLDLNETIDYSLCNEVLYLIEPSTIMLNKLVRRNKNIFNRLNGKKIILNKSLLLNNDVFDFENEAGAKVFYNMPPLDERKRNAIINDFLCKLGLFSSNNNSASNKIFGLFRR